MDLSSFITASNYTISGDRIADPLLTKITEVTGYNWQMYMPSVKIISNMYPWLHNFLLHTWYGAALFILLMIIIGEVLFYKKVKKTKVSYVETNNEFILKHKILAYVVSLYLLMMLLLIGPAIGLVLSIVLLNLPLFFIVLIAASMYGIGLAIVILLGIKVVVIVNKKMFGHLIKKETKEEFDIRQSKYKFKDGSIVKISPNIIETHSVIDGHVASCRLARLSKEGKSYLVHRHDHKDRARLVTGKNNYATFAYECWLEDTTQEAKDIIMKEQEEYKIKEAEDKKKFWGKLEAWLFKF